MSCLKGDHDLCEAYADGRLFPLAEESESELVFDPSTKSVSRKSDVDAEPPMRRKQRKRNDPNQHQHGVKRYGTWLDWSKAEQKNGRAEL